MYQAHLNADLRITSSKRLLDALLLIHMISLPRTVSAFDAIFDVDIKVHMAEYEAEKMKRASCEMKEWVQGADGMSRLPVHPGVPPELLTTLACLKKLPLNLMRFWILYVPFFHTLVTKDNFSLPGKRQYEVRLMQV